MTIRIVIASNSAEFRQNIKSALESSPDLEVCGVAAALDELPAILHELKPDLVLLESSVVKSEEPIEPHAVQFQGHEVKIVVVHRLEDGRLELAGTNAEPIIINLKFESQRFFDTLLDVLSKDSGTLKTEIALSERELEILEMVAAGKTNFKIAQILVISERTVNFHMGNILKKLNAINRAQAVSKGIEQGII